MKRKQIEAIPIGMRSLERWVLWKKVVRNAKPTKVPFQANGKPASSTNPSHWVSFSEAVSALDDGDMDGIGFVFEAGSGMVGIDLDDCLDIHGNPEPWAAEILSRIDTYTEVSPSGRGLKLFAIGPDIGKGRKTYVDSGAIEVYSSGRFFTVTGQSTRSSKLNDCTDGIEWLMSKHFARKCAVYTPGRENVQHLLSVDEVIAKADSAANGHKFQALMRGELNGHQSGSEADLALGSMVAFYTQDFPTWLAVIEQSALWDEKWEREDYQQRTFERSLQQESFWEPRITVTEPMPDGELCDFNITLEHLDQQLAVDPVLPDEIMEVPGFMADVMDWITSQNHRPSRILSLIGAIGLQSALAGRKVRDIRGSRTNIYVVGLAPTGAGKQAPQTCVKKILAATGQSNLFGGKVASDSAMAQDLVECPVKLYLWDEFGRFLDSTKEGKGGNHLHQVQSVLLECWAEAGGPWKHKSLADSRFNREVQQPCLSFCGFTVPTHFWGALEESHLSDGFIPRLLVIDTGDRVKSHNRIETPPPKRILDVASWWRDFQPGTGNLQEVNPEPRLVEEDDRATDMFDALVDESEAKLDTSEADLWTRAIEKARRLALIYACSENHEEPRITEAAARWGIALARWSTQMVSHRIKDEVAPGDQWGQKYKKVLGIIKKMHKENKQAARSALMRELRWRRKDMDEVLESLISAGRIEARTSTSSGGRPTTYYRLKS